MRTHGHVYTLACTHKRACMHTVVCMYIHVCTQMYRLIYKLASTCVHMHAHMQRDTHKHTPR